MAIYQVDIVIQSSNNFSCTKELQKAGVKKNEEIILFPLNQIYANWNSFQNLRRLSVNPHTNQTIGIEMKNEVAFR